LHTNDQVALVDSVADSLAALQNKPQRFIRQVIGSKFFRLGASSSLPERVRTPVGRGFSS
jgi:hypothetical protein